MYIKLARSGEIIIALLIGSFLCWLGYRLFEIGVSGKASLSAERGKVKFQLLNASPGIFFALFGSIIVLISVSQRTKITEHTKQGRTETTYTFEKSSDDVNTLENELVSMVGTLLSIGKEKMKAGEDREAMEYFKSIIDVSREFAEANNAMAQIYLKHNEDIGEAIRIAKIAVSVQPHRSDFCETLQKLENLSKMNSEKPN